MNCAEFEATLQQQADGQIGEHAEAAARQHAQSCPACQELEDGFRLVVQGFAASRLPAPSKNLTDRVLVAARERRVLRPTTHMWRGIAPRLAVAATVLLAVGWWLALQVNRSGEATDSAPDFPASSAAKSPPASDELLFPELAQLESTDSEDGAMLVQAVEPMSQVLRAVGRSFRIPVRPIASATSGAIDALMNELPDAGLPEMPGLRDLMPRSMKKEMPQMRPSS